MIPRSKSVLSFGELLLRFSIDPAGSWTGGSTLPFSVGGAEANVATALALWNIPSAYFTVLPDNLLARQLAAHLEQKNIDTSRIIYFGERMGLFFVPQGGDMKHAGVIYDRKHSSFDLLKPGDFFWDTIFEGVSWFHISAISPALNADTAAVCLEAVQFASSKGIMVSLDLNYRAQLWKDKASIEVMIPIAACCDVIMGNIWSAEKLLGVKLPPYHQATHGTERSWHLAAARTCDEGLLALFPKCKTVALTFRLQEDAKKNDRSTANIGYYSTLNTRDEGLLESDVYEVCGDLNPVGSGDCFMAGLIYGYYHALPIREVLRFATAAAVKKLFEPGDSTSSTVKEIEAMLASGKFLLPQSER